MVASAPSSCNVLKTCWLGPVATTRPAPVGQGSGGFSAATRELFALQRIPEFLGLVTFRERLQRRQVQTGFPLSSRSTSVSLPFTTSRARTRSAVSCLTFDPVRAISSPFAQLTPLSPWQD